jgi:hypothetical protein
METQFTWVIEQLQTKPQDGDHTNVVITAFWRCNGTFADTNGTVYGSASFPPPDGEFTPYAQLTQDQVLGWCYESGVDKSAVEASVDQQIKDQIAPAVVTLPLPWAA